MTKEVLVTLSGIQFDLNAQEPISTVSVGTYEAVEGGHRISYEEYQDEGDGKESEHHNTLTIRPKEIELVKDGDVSTQMLFKPLQKTESYYSTPYGDLVIGMDTKDMTLDVSPDLIEAKIRYGLEINQSMISDCEISIRIESRKKEGKTADTAVNG